MQNTGLFHQQAYINGQWLDVGSGQTQTILSPATAVS